MGKSSGLYHAETKPKFHHFVCKKKPYMMQTHLG